MVSEADEAVVRVGGGDVGRGALLERVCARVRVRVRVHRRQPRAALHQAVEVEGDAVRGRADLDARDLVVAEGLVIVHLWKQGGLLVVLSGRTAASCS